MPTALDPAVPLLLPLDEHNRRLLGEVGPPPRDNPVPAGRYNLVVLGAGPAGLVAAAGAAALGAQVALVEKHLIGGDCLNVGCVPSKALIRVARAAHEARGAGRFGVRIAGGVEVDFPAVMERMRRLRADLAKNDAVERFTRLGVDVFFGAPRFAAADAVDVGGTRLEFARAIVATGARAAMPPIPGLAEAEPRTNETIFWRTELPRRLLVLGSGPIGLELAQAFRRFGSDVVVISRDPRMLPREDPEVTALLSRRFAEEGIALALGAAVQRVESRGRERRVVVERDGRTEAHDGDEILVAAGRAPNVEGLALEAAGIAFDRHGVTVDDRLRTTNRRVYAAGDVCSAYKFTHAADAMARIALRNALFFGRERASDLVIPWCTYTDPEVAHVGLRADEARARGLEVDTLTLEMREVDRAVLDGETEGFARVHLAKGTDRILGATIVAAHAGETIGEMALAITARTGLAALARTVHPYPTQAEVLKKLGDLRGRARLTPRVKGILERVMRWRR